MSTRPWLRLPGTLKPDIDKKRGRKHLERERLATGKVPISSNELNWSSDLDVWIFREILPEASIDFEPERSLLTIDSSERPGSPIRLLTNTILKAWAELLR